MATNVKGRRNSSSLAIDLIKHFESLHDGDLKKVGLQPKMDPVLIWTAGYGHALRDITNSRFLKGEKDRAEAYMSRYAQMTEIQAATLLAFDLDLQYEDIVENMLKPEVLAKLNDHQFGALTSFAYNCGTHYKNSLGKNIPFAIWANIEKWVNKQMTNQELYSYWAASVIKAGGQILPGLVRRRKSEAYLFIYGALNFNP